MKAFELLRISVLPQGAYGVLLDSARLPFAVTLEHTGDGAHTVIPDGVYVCTRTTFYHGGYSTFEIPVPGHSRVLFHRGNFERDSEGCVLVAKSFEGDWIASSRLGFSEFMDRTGGDPTIQLTVRTVEEAG